MTIEEKAQRYDEAIKTTRKWYDANTNEGYRGIFEDIFPEFKNSEDEIIRRGLVEGFQQYDEEECWRDIKHLKIKDILAWLEKQGEQKPADIVEPKFKVGDWITNGQLICKVLSIASKSYELHLYNDDYCHFGTDVQKVDEYYHLWTIQDAKSGDVLHSIGWHNDCIFIFNGIDNWKFDEPNGDKAVATGYCCLFVSSDKMEFGIQGPDCIEVNTVKPATKIQHDLLFAKMKEAGYEWDAEKKELKKIEQKSTFEMKTPEESLGIDSETYNKIVDECIYGEQKPTDKVEPKFKNGQWVVWQDKCYKVNYNGYGYELVDQNGLSTSLEYGTIDENAHLWDITKDAKDGDVLSYRDGQWIFIYKEKIDNSSFYYHTLYSTVHQDLTINDAGFTLLGDAIIPATKEQRELLFQKMTEAGYEWDANKLEPKKIDMQELVKQNPAWSEEDDQYLLVCKNALAKYQVSDKWNATIISRWLEDKLKSLKDRVLPQPKQEWSEEDKEVINLLLELIYEQDKINPRIPSNEKRKMMLSWLKSLRPRSHWKPSDEQMKALKEAVDEHFDIDGGALWHLYEDLKKLKD